MRCIKGGESGRFARGDTICPEGVWCDSGPLRDSAFACLDDRFSDRAVLAFDDAVRTGVVSGNPDVSDTVPLSEPIQRSNEGCAVVRDDFFDGTPSAQDIFENKRGEGACSFGS